MIAHAVKSCFVRLINMNASHRATESDWRVGVYWLRRGSRLVSRVRILATDGVVEDQDL